MLKRLIPRLFLFILIIFVLIIMVLNLRQFLVRTIVKTEMLRAGEALQAVSAEITLLKKEQLIIAPVNGRVNLVQEPGSKVRVGEKIAEIVSRESLNPVAIYCPVAGVLDYSDGLENVLTVELADLIDMESVPIVDATVRDAGEHEVDKGQPICKIVDNLMPLCAIALAKDMEKIFSQDEKSVTIIWNGHNIHAQVQDIAGKTSGRAVLEISNYPGDFARERQVEVEVVTGSVKGLVVSPDSLVEKEDKPGLFVIRSLRASWEPVNILDESDAGIIVEGEFLKENDLYIVNPFLVKEGDRV